MSKIVIREIDNTGNNVQNYANFAVVVPGFYSKEYEAGKEPWDENGIYKCNSLTEFENNVGMVGATQERPHYGNQIAYELIKMGYTVLYKRMASGLDILALDSYWDPLRDRFMYDFRYVLTGLLDDALAGNGANAAISRLVSYNNDKEVFADGQGRGDCIALIDIPESQYSVENSQKENVKKIAEYVYNAVETTKYCAFFAPVVTYSFERDAAYDDKNAYKNNRKFPAAFHYLACAAKASENYNEWFANSGYERGKANFGITGVGIKLGEAAVSMLQPRQITAITQNVNLEKAVNVVIKAGDEYLLWGNRTANKLRSKDEKKNDLIASDFLNIRQLCCTLKKQIYVACKQLSFNPNSNVLWIDFKNKLTPILEKMKSDQGISDYEFVKVATTQKGILKAQIKIVPIEAVEDFDIEVSLEDSINGTVVTEI